MASHHWGNRFLIHAWSISCTSHSEGSIHHFHLVHRASVSALETFVGVQQITKKFKTFGYTRKEIDSCYIRVIIEDMLVKAFARGDRKLADDLVQLSHKLMVLSHFWRVRDHFDQERNFSSENLDGIDSWKHILGENRSLGIWIDGLSHMIHSNALRVRSCQVVIETNEPLSLMLILVQEVRESLLIHGLLRRGVHN